MNRFWDTIGVVFALAGVFLILYYWKGTKEVITAGAGALTDTLQAVTGGVKDGWTRSSPS